MKKIVALNRSLKSVNSAVICQHCQQCSEDALITITKVMVSLTSKSFRLFPVILCEMHLQHPNPVSFTDIFFFFLQTSSYDNDGFIQVRIAVSFFLISPLAYCNESKSKHTHKKRTKLQCCFKSLCSFYHPFFPTNAHHQFVQCKLRKLFSGHDCKAQLNQSKDYEALS